MKTVVLAGVFAALSASFAYADASDYPEQPVRLIVPYAPGGGTDVAARLLAQELSDIFDNPVVVENHSGATGSVGANVIAQAEPDGHTLGLVIATYITNPLLYSNLPYTLDSFAPVTLIGETPYILTVHPSVPAETAEEFIAYLEENPGELAFASSGVGGGPHLAAELLMQQTGTEMIHVPYRGAGPANADLLSGEVQVMFNNFTASISSIEDGRLRLLAVTSAERSHVSPDTPSLGEIVPGTEITNWYGVVAPAGTPEDIIKKAQEAVAEAIQRPSIRDRLVAEGWVLVGNTPDEFAEFLRLETERWEDVIGAAGVELQ